MLKWFGGLMDRIFAVVGAIILAQAPLFMQQYTQQLVSRESELRLQVGAMRHAASLSGKTLEQLAQKFIENSDADVARQGEIMLAMLSRWHNLSDALAAMQESSIWSRPLAFLYHLNTDAFSSTLHHFTIGLPLNMEGGVYALLGLAMGCLVFTFFKGLCRKISHACMQKLRRYPLKQTV